MTKSLRDQLVAAGLAKPSQAKKAQKQAQAEAQAREKRAKGGGGKGGAKADVPVNKESTSRLRARQAQTEKVARDREMAESRNSKAAARAIRAQIKQLIAQNDQRSPDVHEDDVAYNFLHNKKVKRIHVRPDQVALLSKGELIVINNDGLYHLVSKDIADKIAQRDPRWIVVQHDRSADEAEVDDFYKKFEVPDDLDW